MPQVENPQYREALKAAEQQMREAGVSPLAVEVFAHNFHQLSSGETGLVHEEDIDPYLDAAQIQDRRFSEEDQGQALRQTAVIKLNGGLGTSMGLDRAKTLLQVREGNTFLDIIATQVLATRRRFGVELPLVFMNSFRTDADTLAYLERYPDLKVGGLPLSFLQSQEPRLVADTLWPLDLPSNPAAQWCPPGHGDLYVSLQASGLLHALLDRGFLYLQVSNGDNLGATVDPDIAAWFAQSGAPFAMEVSRRTRNDRKGGHLARRRRDGALVLRESAQTADEDRGNFEDIQKHPYFNTNTIWLNLRDLERALAERNGVLGLPIIRNIKHIEGEDGASIDVVQIETAMGSAISTFPAARAVEVPRSRFLPVKTTNELMLLRSDLYRLDDLGRVLAQRDSTPPVTLAAPYYGTIEDFDLRVPEVPSLIDAESLTVEGDWFFQPGARVQGDVLLGPEGGTFA